MGKKNSNRGSKKNKANKTCRVNNTESKLEKEQQQQKTSFEEIAQIFLGSNPEQNINNNANLNEDLSNENEANVGENTNASANADNDINVIQEKQQEILKNLKNLNDAIAAMTLTRDNIASLRIEVLSNIYFTREVRPLIDAVNLISFASSNMSNVANNLNINTNGDRKEIKDAFKLVYKMNNEVDDMLCALSRRIRLYVAQLDKMDRNCPPFSCDEDSQS